MWLSLRLTFKEKFNCGRFDFDQSIPNGATKRAHVSRQDVSTALDHQSPIFQAQTVLVDVAGRTRWVHVFDDVALRVVRRPRHPEPIIAPDWLDVVGVPAFAELAAAISAAPAEFLAQCLTLDFGEPHAGPFAAPIAASIARMNASDTSEANAGSSGVTTKPPN